jgi:hypothetical protein
MALKLTEQFLAGSGSVALRYFLTSSEKRPHLEILIIRYTGEYPFGSGGNADAIYMHAMATAAVTAFGPFGVIHDFSELRYEWGDLLEMVFGVGPEIERSPDNLQEKVFGVGPEAKASPVAIVVGPGCEEAIRTLFHGVDSSEPIDTVGWVFRDLHAAWRYVTDRIG